MSAEGLLEARHPDASGSRQASSEKAPPQVPFRQRARTILVLALPIIGGMVSQNVLNLVDTAMVGSLGDAALAAVGAGGFANFMASSVVLGLSASVQAMAARRIGEGRADQAAVPLNGSLLLAAAVAIPWSLMLILLAPTLFPLINGDPEVAAAGTPYFRARLVAMVAIGMNFCFRGYWNGVNRSGMYFRTLLVMHAANIFLNWVLIFGNLGAPKLGAFGAGVASAIATFGGTAYYFYLGLRHAREGGFAKTLPDAKGFQTLVRLAVPSSIQQLFFSTGFVMLFWILGKTGTSETAAASVLLNIMLVAVLPGLGLGLAAASLVSQSLGRRDRAAAKRWGWDVILVEMVVLGVLGLPMVLVPEALLSVFLHDAATLKLATLPLRLVGATIAFDAIGLVLIQALQGAGANRLTMLIAVGLQWGLFLPAAYLIGPVLGLGLLGIWIAQIVYRVLQSALFAVVWHRDGWSNIHV